MIFVNITTMKNEDGPSNVLTSSLHMYKFRNGSLMYQGFAKCENISVSSYGSNSNADWRRSNVFAIYDHYPLDFILEPAFNMSLVRGDSGTYLFNVVFLSGALNTAMTQMINLVHYIHRDRLFTDHENNITLCHPQFAWTAVGRWM